MLDFKRSEDSMYSLCVAPTPMQPFFLKRIVGQNSLGRGVKVGECGPGATRGSEAKE